MPTLRSQSCIAPVANSGPLSDRMYSAEPCLKKDRIERFENVVGSHLGANRDGKGLPRELIQNCQHQVYFGSCRNSFGSTVAAASTPPQSAPGIPGVRTS